MEVESIGILKQALPYIRRYKGKTFVIKLGGELIQNTEVIDEITQDISLIYQIGIKIILIHGGGPQATELSKKLGISPKIIGGRRITDEETLEVVKMIFAGKLNHEILTLLRKHGAKSVGLSGIDGDIVVAKRRPPVAISNDETGEKNEIDFGHVGDIVSINTELLEILLQQNYIPVISSIADDGMGNILNINADTIASHIAAAVKADKYITMTNVPGLLKNPEDPSTKISYISVRDIKKLMKEGIIKGGMIPKIKECLYALEQGVSRVHILNGFEKNSLLKEVFTNIGTGTMILRDEDIEEYIKTGY